MRALKVLIVIMGVLLVLGFAVLAAVVVKKFQEQDHPTSIPQSKSLTIPEGYKIVTISDIAGQLVIHLQSSNLYESVLIVDPRTGKEIKRIESDTSRNLGR